MDTKRAVLENAVVAAGYAGAAWLFNHAHPGGGTMLVCAPAGIALAAVMMWGYRVCWGVAIGAFIVCMILGGSAPVAGGIAIGNVLEAAAGAWALRLLRCRPDLSRLRDVLVFVGLAAIVGSSIGATFGVSSLWLGRQLSSLAAVDAWQAWWWGDIVAIVLVAPVLLTWTVRDSVGVPWKTPQIVERVALIAFLSLTLAVVFGRPEGWPRALTRPYTLYALLFWGALRFGPRGAAAVSFVMGMVALTTTAYGYGPFVRGSFHDNMQMLQSFLAFGTVCSLAAAAVVAEREAYHASVEQAAALKSSSLDAALDAVISVDHHGMIREFNKSAESLFGFHRNDVIGKPVADIIIPARLRDAHRDGFARNLVTDTRAFAGRRMRLPALRADGSEFFAEISLARVAVGGLPVFTGFLRDITAVTEAEQRVLAAREQLAERVEARTAELKRVNLDLEDREHQLQEAQLLAHIGSFEWYIDERRFRSSDELNRIFGLEEGRSLDDALLCERIDPASRARVHAAIDDPRAFHEALEIEVHLDRPDGVARVLNLRARVETDERGRAVRVFGTCQDITERTRAEETRRHLASIVESSADAIVSQSLHGVIESWNRGAESMFGYAKTAAVGQPIETTIPAGQQSEFLRHIERVTANGEATSFETVRRHRDGSTFDVSLTVSPVLDATGRVAGVSTITRDISGPKKAEAKVKGLLEASPDGIVVLDAAGQIVLANSRMESMFGRRRAELIGTSVEALFPERFRSRSLAQTHTGLLDATQWPIACAPALFGLREDRSEFPAEISVSSIRLEGEILASVTIRDVTDRRGIEQRLRASLNEKEVLLRELHHRVKNNLQVVASMLNLQGSTLDNVEARRGVRDSEDRIRLMALVHELLYQSDDLRSIRFAGYVETLVGRLARSHGVEAGAIEVSSNARDIHVDVDIAIPCGLIINELVSNAVEHAFPSGVIGHIVVSFAHTDDGRFAITVSDDGVGMPPQTESGSTRTLGLQIVEALTRQLCGEITTHCDRGTCVRIAFSVAPQTNESPMPHEARAA